MDRSHFFERLYPLQDEALRALAASETGFYLSGGTAASRGYLQHRFSDDLDLFVNDHPSFGLWADRYVDRLGRRSGWTLRVLLREARFVRVEVASPLATLKIEMTNDVPAHAGLFPPDLARRMLSASRSDWDLIRWIDAPEPERYLVELRRLGEQLALLPPPR